MWIPFLPIKLWWLPTSEDREKWRKEDIDFSKKDLPIELDKFLESTSKYDMAMSKLTATFTDEQKKLFLEARVCASDASFHNNRYKNCLNTINQ